MNHMKLAAIILVLLPTTAHAAPTLNPPTPASLADSRPLLTWTPGPGETTHTIVVATNPATTPEGEFFEENRVSFDIVDETQRAWQSTTRNPAGTYWWNMRWSTEAPDYVSAYTAPLAFTIPAYLRNPAVSIRQWQYSKDTMTMSYTGNMPLVTSKCYVYLGAKIIARGNGKNASSPIGTKGTITCEINVASKYKGKRLKMYAEMRGGGKLAKIARYFVGGA